MLHDRLGHHRSQRWIRPELHSFDCVARTTRGVRSELKDSGLKEPTKGLIAGVVLYFAWLHPNYRIMVTSSQRIPRSRVGRH